MMEQAAGYLINVCAAAVFCALITVLGSKSGTVGAVTKLLTGLFLAVSVISPLAKISIDSLDTFLNGLSLDASRAVEEGNAASDRMLRDGIKDQVEAYILDKAADNGAQIQVEVTLSEYDPPLPCAALITGDISPMGKLALSQILEEDLGIPKEAQEWTG